MSEGLFDTRLYDYELPPELIAQQPMDPRDSSRLMVIDRKKKTLYHDIFRSIMEHINPGDLMVMNNTRVIPARLFGRKKSGTAIIEVFLLGSLETDQDRWKALVRPGKRVKPGTFIVLENGLEIEIQESLDEGIRMVRFPEGTHVMDLLDEIGQVPLPPYIHREDITPSLYQTVFAKEHGSVAAPTASLHFTESLLERMRNKGIQFAWLTLHVGLGTFRPVKETDIRNHNIHEEFCEVPRETAFLVNKAIDEGRRVIAVGTTVVRTLESMKDESGKLRAGKVNTSLFIYPGYTFSIVDAMITNFHLPKSTLLMLVSAFTGRELTFRAYETAIREKYRFFSFGDAMLIK